MSACHGPSVSQNSLSFIHFYAVGHDRLAGSRCHQARYRARFGTRTVRSDGSGSATNVTGCYAKRGSSAGEVTLTGADGSGWELRSDTVELDQHIGHQVTVTGTASHETKAEEKKEGQVENASSKEAFWHLNCSGRENG
jgi:hypothetical protein